MKVISLLALFFAAAQAFQVQPPAGRRAFLDFAGAALITTGSVALVNKQPAVAFPLPGTKSNAKSAKTNSMCELENPFDIPSIASCYGEMKGMTPTEEASADSLLSKFDIQPADIKGE